MKSRLLNVIAFVTGALVALGTMAHAAPTGGAGGGVQNTPLEFSLDPDDGQSLIVRFPAATTDPLLQCYLHNAALNPPSPYGYWESRPADGSDILSFKVLHVDCDRPRSK